MPKEIVLEFDDLLKDAISGLPEKVQIKVWEELRLRPIDVEVDEVAGWYGFYAVLAEKADLRLMKLELAFSIWKEDRSEAMRTSLAAERKKSLTNARMESYLKTLANYRGFELKVVEYTFERNVLRTIAKAFGMKKDLVQTKAANMRQEIR